MKEEMIFKGKIFDVIRKEMVVNGHAAIRDIVIHHGGVALCCIADDKILLVRQSRAAVDVKTLEIPAGTLEEGEDAAACGLRELNEETGFGCESLHLITAFWPTPGYDTEVIYIYEARGLYPIEDKLPMDDTEDIEICWVDLEQAYEMIGQGAIKDGKTIIAIQHAMLRKLKQLQENKETV